MPVDPKDTRRAQIITTLLARIDVAEKAKHILVQKADRANAQLASADRRIADWKVAIEREMGRLKERPEPPATPRPGGPP